MHIYDTVKVADIVPSAVVCSVLLIKHNIINRFLIIICQGIEMSNTIA
jgi:hypothetical protein